MYVCTVHVHVRFEYCAMIKVPTRTLEYEYSTTTQQYLEYFKIPDSKPRLGTARGEVVSDSPVVALLRGN